MGQPGWGEDPRRWSRKDMKYGTTRMGRGSKEMVKKKKRYDGNGSTTPWGFVAKANCWLVRFLKLRGLIVTPE